MASEEAGCSPTRPNYTPDAQVAFMTSKLRRYESAAALVLAISHQHIRHTPSALVEASLGHALPPLPLRVH
jgi:hypothetical protein